jgi:uncharacterized protein (DUF1810 family)
MHDPFDLERFVQAQAGTYDAALEELRAGAKRSHWMWFIFPQLQGLGTSAMARRYAISGLAEARAYLAHPLLGPRLMACVDALLAHDTLSARDILGTPDDLKLRSSMTLFHVATGDPRFQAVLDRYYGGRPDEATLRLLDSAE